jgi:hypothetical protein
VSFALYSIKVPRDADLKGRYVLCKICLPHFSRRLQSSHLAVAAWRFFLQRFICFSSICSRLHCYSFVMEPHYNSQVIQVCAQLNGRRRLQLSATRFQYHPQVMSPRISVMCPNPPTRNLSNMVIGITKVHTPSPLLPFHRPRHFDLVSLEILFPLLNVRP